MATRTCTVPECEKKHYGHGLCVMHYSRLRKNGDVNVVKREFRRPDICTIDGCEAEHIAKGYCKRHYYHFKRHGDPTRPLVERVGPNAPNWQGGRVLVHGYVRIYVDPSDPYIEMASDKGYVYEHRIVLARALGRPLARHETVHHIDGNPLNNALSNLQLRFGKHGSGIRMQCQECGSDNVKAVPLG